jgi:excisionase family DNA binding protein
MAAAMTDPPPDTVARLEVPALFSVRTTAQLLDLPPRTIRRRIDDGELPAVREHDRTMIRADELRDYFDRLERIGRTPGPAAPVATPATLRLSALKRPVLPAVCWSRSKAVPHRRTPGTGP